MGATQAQVYRWAKWAIGLRMKAGDELQVEKAIQDKKVVRSWLFRGTLHFVTSNDLSWLTSLLAPDNIKANTRRYRQLSLDERIFIDSQKVIRNAIEKRGPLTRLEIKTHLEKEGFPAKGQQLPYLLQRAALDGLICQGPLSGREPSYVLISDWIETQPILGREDAIQKLAVIYFKSRCPATIDDFSWWSGLSKREVRPIVASSPEISPLELDGIQYWVTGDAPPSEVLSMECLLPPFDEYLISYKDRSHMLAPSFTKEVNKGGGMLKPCVMVNGEILGTWSYKEEKKQMHILLKPFVKEDFPAGRWASRATGQLANYLSMPVKVEADNN